MTWQEFQYEYRAMPLHLMNVEHLARLSAFTPSILGPEERIDFEEAKRVIRDELATGETGASGRRRLSSVAWSGIGRTSSMMSM